MVLAYAHTRAHRLLALLKARGRAAWDAVQEPLAVALRQLDADAQVATADGLRVAVELGALPAADAADCLLPLAVGSTQASKERCDEVRVPADGGASVSMHA